LRSRRPKSVSGGRIVDDAWIWPRRAIRNPSPCGKHYFNDARAWSVLSLERDSDLAFAAVGIEKAFQLLLEFAHIFEIAVDRSEADVGNRVEAFELIHD
jgi:hypothetical protein